MQAQAMGMPVPDYIANKPVLDESLALYWRAFADLTTCRRFADGPIPWDAIAQYGISIDLSNDQLDDLDYIIRCMDNAFLAWREQQINKNRK